MNSANRKQSLCRDLENYVWVRFGCLNLKWVICCLLCQDLTKHFIKPF